jgi:hypothetical protein
VTLLGPTTANGGVTMTSGRLAVNGHRFVVNGDLTFSTALTDVVALDFGAPDGQPSAVQVAGTFDAGATHFLSMHEASDSLIVAGDAFFFGAVTADTALTGGVIVLGGGFDEDGSPGFWANVAGDNKLVMVSDGGGSGVDFWLASGFVRHFEVASTGIVRMGYSGSTIYGDLAVTGSGVFDASSGVTVNGKLVTSGNGVLRQSSGEVIVLGSATFEGGSTSGQLLGGLLTLRGDFTQLSTNSAASFHAEAGHTTQFVSDGTHLVSFATPDSLPDRISVRCVSSRSPRDPTAAPSPCRPRPWRSGP